MNFALLALLGVGALAMARAQGAGSQAGGIEGDFTVLCPSRLPSLPEHAPAASAYGNWMEPCDDQTVVNAPPAPFFEGCGPRGCHVLPDGTPLYQYTLDGTTSASIAAEFDAGTRSNVFTQTWFAGVPLEYPPLRPGGGPWYSMASTKKGLGAPSGIAALNISNTPAPYAWKKSTAAVDGAVGGIGSVTTKDAFTGETRTVESDSFDHTMQQIDAALPAGLPAVTWRPVDPSYDAPSVARAWAPDIDLQNFVNNIGTYACTALSTGLKVATYVEPTGIGQSIAKSISKNESTINHFQKLCGAR
jgi:hypothetical protein